MDKTKISVIIAMVVIAVVCFSLGSIIGFQAGYDNGNKNFMKSAVVQGYAHYEIGQDGSAFWKWNNSEKK